MKKLRVLIIEDMESDAALVVRAIERGGYAVEWRRVDSAEGVKAALGGQAWDAVLCDYAMPGFGGADALALVRGGGWDLPFIFVSGTMGEEVAVDAMRSGAHDYVLKENLRRLVPAIERKVREAEIRRRRRLAESALQESHQRYRRTLDAMMEGCQIIGFDWRYLYVNDAVAVHGRVPKDRLLGRTMMEVFPGIERTEAFALVRRCMEERAPETLENEFKFSDGTTAWFDLSVQPAPEGVFLLSIDITERKRVEQALRRSEAEFRAMFELASVGMAQTDPGTGRWLRVNDRMCAITGYSRDEMLAMRVPDLTHPEDRDRDWALFRSVVRGETPDYRVEKRYIRKNGDVAWVNVNMTVIRDAVGTPVRTMATIEDIGERKRAEAALRASEATHRRLIESAGDAIMIVSPPEFRFRSGNPAAVAMFRARDEAEFVTKGPWDVSPEVQPDGRSSVEKARAMIEMALREGSCAFEWAHRRLDGECFPALVQLTRFEVEGQVWVHATVRDVTTERRAVESQALLARAVEQAAEAIVITDADAAIQYVNPAFERVTGYCRAEVLGANPRILKSGAHDAEFFRRMWEVLGRGEVWKGELVNKRKDGTRYTEEAAISAVRDAAGRVVNYVAVKHDVTERKRIEEEFLRAQRLENVGALAGGIAHDMNNILTPVIMLMPVLRDSVSDPELAESLESVETCARRGADILRQLLAFARGLEGSREALETRRLFHEVIGIMRETFPRAISIRGDVPDGIWPVDGVATRMHQVLMNLCVNARDAMPEGGRLTLAAENVVLDEAAVRKTPGLKPGRHVVWRVSDTGTGIDPADVARIFEPFFSTKAADKGTGLGLSTAQGIVRNHGGWLDVSSQPGRGTEFRVVLPAAGEPGLAEVEADTAPMPMGAGELVLIVDDEAGVRTVTERVLEYYGYRVIIAADGSAAVRLYAERRGEIRVVLTDLDMPSPNGSAVVRAIREMDPAVRIVWMSGHPCADARLGGGHFLEKPFTPRRLLEVLRQALLEV